MMGSLTGSLAAKEQLTTMFNEIIEKLLKSNKSNENKIYSEAFSYYMKKKVTNNQFNNSLRKP